jgi:hypothetical protein
MYETWIKFLQRVGHGFAQGMTIDKAVGGSCSSSKPVFCMRNKKACVDKMPKIHLRTNIFSKLSPCFMGVMRGPNEKIYRNL